MKAFAPIGDYCIPASVTPIDAVYENFNAPINYDMLAIHIIRLLNGGVDGLVIGGCTGADSLLEDDEQVKLVKFVNKNWGDENLIIAGDGSNKTQHAIDLAAKMEQEAGVFTHLSVSPYKVKPTQRGIIRHYEEILNAIEGELIAYNVRGRTGGNGIEPETLAILAQHERFIGVKEASGGQLALDRVEKTVELTSELDFIVLSGDDDQAFEMIKRGARGLISVAANVDPEGMSNMIHLYRTSPEEALKMNEERKILYEAMFLPDENNPQCVHFALRFMGYEVGIPRLPLTDVSEVNKVKIYNALKGLNLINFNKTLGFLLGKKS
ncbi:MAG: dihydrodipicolinate synthase family protein [archaeon]